MGDLLFFVYEPWFQLGMLFFIILILIIMGLYFCWHYISLILTNKAAQKNKQWMDPEPVKTEVSQEGVEQEQNVASISNDLQPALSQTDNTVNEEYMRIFVGEEYPYYKDSWDYADERNRKISWNWGIFFGGIFWFIYRKMYSYAAILFGISVMVIILEIYLKITFVLMVGFHFCMALYGNYLYREHIQFEINKITHNPTTEKVEKILARTGGVNGWVIIGYIFLYILLTVYKYAGK